MDLNSPPVNTARILWFEDDVRFVEQLQPHLSTHFQIDHVCEFNEDAPPSDGYDAALVDLSLLKENSSQLVVEKLRAKGFCGAILVLSSDESVATKVRFLRQGINDYLWKTMEIPELQARIQNAIELQSSSKLRTHEVSRSGLTLDLVTQKAHLGGQIYVLTRVEFRFLHLLLTYHGELIPVSELAHKVWDLNYVDRGAQDTLAWKLNKKLNDWNLRIRRTGDIFRLVPKDQPH